MVCANSKGSDQPAHTRSQIRAFASRLNTLTLRLLTKHHLEFLNLKDGCTGSSDSTHVKMPHCWKSHVTAHIDCHFFAIRYAEVTNERSYLDQSKFTSDRYQALSQESMSFGAAARRGLKLLAQLQRLIHYCIIIPKMNQS